MINIGERIISARTQTGWTRAELAEKMGVSYQVITNYENGLRSPDLEMLAKLSDVLSVSCDYLLGQTNFYSLDDEHKIKSLVCAEEGTNSFVVNLIRKVIKITEKMNISGTDNRDAFFAEQTATALSELLNMMLYTIDTIAVNDYDMKVYFNVLQSLKEKPISYDDLGKIQVSQGQIDACIRCLYKFFACYSYSIHNFNKQELQPAPNFAPYENTKK